MNYRITFRLEEGAPVEGKVVYRPEEYSFDFEPRKGGGGQTIAINDIQLDFNLETHQIYYAYGLCTYYGYWKDTNLLPFPARHGKLFASFLNDKEILPGMSYAYTKGHYDWPVYFNSNAGWVCIGQPEFIEKYKAVEFATDSIAVLEGDKLKAIWLHPEDLSEIIKYRRPLPSNA